MVSVPARDTRHPGSVGSSCERRPPSSAWRPRLRDSTTTLAQSQEAFPNASPRVGQVGGCLGASSAGSRRQVGYALCWPVALLAAPAISQRQAGPSLSFPGHRGMHTASSQPASLVADGAPCWASGSGDTTCSRLVPACQRDWRPGQERRVEQDDE